MQKPFKPYGDVEGGERVVFLFRLMGVWLWMGCVVAGGVGVCVGEVLQAPWWRRGWQGRRAAQSCVGCVVGVTWVGVVGVGCGGVVLLSAAGPGCVGAVVVSLSCACACVACVRGCGCGG